MFLEKTKKREVNKRICKVKLYSTLEQIVAKLSGLTTGNFLVFLLIL